MRAVRRLSLGVTLCALVTAGLAPAGPVASAALAEQPTVAISSPVAGASTPPGVVQVTAAGDAYSGDQPLRIELDVDGVLLAGSTQTCPASSTHCAATFTWDTSGLNSTKTLTAVLYTNAYNGQGTTSAPVTVTTSNPAPTVAITSPTPGSVDLSSPLTVSAVGSIDLSQSDHPTAMQLWVDGVKYGLPWSCTEAATTAQLCNPTFSVATRTWTGAHTLQVEMTSNATAPSTFTRTVSSTVVTFLVHSPSRLALSPIAAVHAGKLAVIRGHAVATNNGQAMAGAKVAVTLAPAYGKKRVVTVTTGATGAFSLATKIVANTTVTARLLATSSSGAALAKLPAPAYAPVSCSFDSHLRHQAFDAGTCRVAHLPARTKVTLQYEAGKKWHTLVSGAVDGPKIPISFTFGKRGTYPMRLVVNANKVYLKTYGPIFSVKVT